MLESIHNAANGKVGKAVMTVLLGLIIVSFAVWGIGDIFRDTVSTTAATVGDQTISTDQYRTAFQQQVNQYARLLKQPLTTQQALAMGIDQAVIDRLASEAALNSRAQALGLSLSDAQIVSMVQKDPNFADANGQFNRGTFDELLRQLGMTEAGFFAAQRSAYVRREMQQALAGGVTAPKALVETLARIDGQTRSIDYFVLPPAAVPTPAAPTDDELKAFFEARKSAYRAPQYRALTIVEAAPEALAKPGEVSDEDAKAAYEKDKATRFTVAAQRRVEQIVFPNDAEANAAADKIKGGASFDDIVKERNLAPADIDLGVVTRDAMFDPVLADAAFALPEGGVSGVVKGQFGPTILRATGIVEGKVKSYDEVAADLKKDIAVKRTSAEIGQIHDQIEDARVSGKTLAEAAKAAGLEPKTIAAVDAQGLGKDGVKVALPGGTELLKAAFASDVGGDDPPLQTKGSGYVWFDVAKIEPEHDRTLEEAKERVTADFAAEALRKALLAKADDLVKQLKDGADIAKLAADLGLEKKTATGIKRAGGVGIPPAVATAVFQTPPNGAGSAADPAGRYVFKVTSDDLPAFDASTPTADKAAKALGEGISADMIGSYVDAVKKQLGVSIDQAALKRSIGP